MLKDLKHEDIIYQKELLIIITSSMKKKNNDQPIDSYIKQYKEIRKLRTGQGEDYTIGCLLDYDYIKNYYRLRAVNLTRQKDADPNSAIIQQ